MASAKAARLLCVREVVTSFFDWRSLVIYFLGFYELELELMMYKSPSQIFPIVFYSWTPPLPCLCCCIIVIYFCYFSGLKNCENYLNPLEIPGKSKESTECMPSTGSSSGRGAWTSQSLLPVPRALGVPLGLLTSLMPAGGCVVMTRTNWDFTEQFHSRIRSNSWKGGGGGTGQWLSLLI